MVGILQPLFGAIVILSIAIACSTNRRAINWRTVAWGLSLQVVFALLVLKTAAGQRVFSSLGAGINKLLGFAGVGSAFVFGPLGDSSVWGRVMMAKMLVPETEVPKTMGTVKLDVEMTDVNVIDAAGRGTGEGLHLALNVGAMLISFLALVALVNYLLGFAHLSMGHQVTLPITDGALDLGPWEQVFYAEFDGQRAKRVVVKVVGIGTDVMM